MILIATNPPEPLVEITRHLAGHDRVLSTSTTLDSLRFRLHLSERLDVSPASVEAYVIGEHGTASVFLWSSARIGGMPVPDLLARRGLKLDEFRQSIEHDVRYANITIIEGIGASQYGIGMSQPASRKWCCVTNGRSTRWARTTPAMAWRCRCPA